MVFERNTQAVVLGGISTYMSIIWPIVFTMEGMKNIKKVKTKIILEVSGRHAWRAVHDNNNKNTKNVVRQLP